MAEKEQPQNREEIINSGGERRTRKRGKGQKMSLASFIAGSDRSDSKRVFGVRSMALLCRVANQNSKTCLMGHQTKCELKNPIHVSYLRFHLKYDSGDENF